jgi:hypothetical protein
MLIVIVLMIVTMTEFILCAIAATLNGMYQMVLLKKHQGTKHIRLVDCQDLTLQFCQRLWLHRGSQGLCYHNTIGGGFDIVLFEQSNTGCFVHDNASLFIFGHKDTK